MSSDKLGLFRIQFTDNNRQLKNRKGKIIPVCKVITIIYMKIKNKDHSELLLIQGLE